MKLQYKILKILIIMIFILFGLSMVIEANSSNGLKIVLDPGHGGYDPGALNTSLNIQEKDVNLKITRYLKNYLEEYYGVEIIQTHDGLPSDTKMELVDRGMVARNNNADLFVSLHINSSDSATLKGAEVYVSACKLLPKYNEETTKLGNKILNNLSSLGIGNRGVKTRLCNDRGPKWEYSDGSIADYYGVIRYSMKGDSEDRGANLAAGEGIPAILIESCFINGTDTQFIDSDEDIQKIAMKIGQGIVEHYGLILKSKMTKVSYTTHVQNIGWQEYVSDGEMSGTSGKSYRLEGIKIKLENAPVSGGITYSTHVQNEGWQEWVKDDEMSGTSGKSLRLEAIKIKLTGEMANKYDVYYRVHAQEFGWLDWAKNGAEAGTAGYSYRLEGIEIRLVEKGGSAPGTTTRAFVQSPVRVVYTTHVQNEGWQKEVRDGVTSGTVGKGLRLEGIRMNLENTGLNGLTGGISYRTHIQNIGWQDWKENNAMSGTSGKSLRLEAIQIKLTDKVEEEYDVYYRVQAQNFGWLGWAKNGEEAGTAGYGYRLESIQIVLVKKGMEAPGSTENAFRNK